MQPEFTRARLIWAAKFIGEANLAHESPGESVENSKTQIVPSLGSQMSLRCLARLRKEVEQVEKEFTSELFKIVHLDPTFNSVATGELSLNWRISFIPLQLDVAAQTPFLLDVFFPEKYPFEPPIVKMLTCALQHPNIDAQGDVCLDILRLPPSVNWASLTDREIGSQLSTL